MKTKGSLKTSILKKTGMFLGSNRANHLRPETVESLFYLYRYTGDRKYRDWGRQIWRAIRVHSQRAFGFSSVADADEIARNDLALQESFFMAETLKYFYLLFSPPEKLDLEHYVFSTEGHPFRWKLLMI